MTIWIIEHPRGTLKDYDVDSFKFSYTGSRNDPENTLHFFTVQRAAEVLNRMPKDLRQKCTILKLTDTGQWVKVFP